MTRTHLIEIAPPRYDVDLQIAYATPENFTGKPIYRRAAAYLSEEAAGLLDAAIALAADVGLQIRVFDAFRPSEAQWVLWNHTPDPGYISDPRKGSPHSRGAAVDLTLIDKDGRALPMGTEFDDFTEAAHHGNRDIDEQAQRNRMLLLGLMTAAGWDYFRNEWWHYQLYEPERLPLLSDDALPDGMM